MATYSSFPGCALHKSSQEYDRSTRLVCRALGIELKELRDWSCCGAAPAHHTDSELAAALAGRNLALAGQEQLPLMAPCPACFSRLKGTARQLRDNPQLSQKLQEKYQISFQQITVLHLLEVLRQIEPAKIKSLLKIDLSALKVVPYYGCLLVRPSRIGIDDLENPVMLDEILKLIGIQPLDWDAKVTCCGSTIGVGDKNVVVKLTGDIMRRANLAGARAVVVACPLCHSNLDLRQRQIQSRRGDFEILPVFYITQLMGLAFGYAPGQVGLDKNIVDPLPLLKEIGLKT